MTRERQKISEQATALGARTQVQRFIGTARALGCDEDEAAFDEKLKAVVGPKVKHEPTPSPSPKEAHKAGDV